MKEEWNSLLHSTWIKVVLIAIMIIPMAYAGVFLGSMWDPYGNADKIPVAVVNLDKEVSYNGTKLHVGDDLVANLKENKAMDFHFVNKEKASTGLHDGTYYMTILIPESFSHNATTLLQDEPKKMILTYETNPGTNYIASKMDETAVRKIKESVSTSITKTYADTIFSQVKTLSSGLKDASDGSSQLNNGVDQTISGNKTINENLIVLANSTLTFKEGANTLENGLQTYTDGVAKVNAGVNDIDHGVKELEQKSGVLSNGIRNLSSGSNALNQGVHDYTDGVNSLKSGGDALVQNNAALNGGMQSLSDGVRQMNTASTQILNGAQSMSYTLSSMLNEQTKQQIEALQNGAVSLQQQDQGMMSALQGKVDNGTATQAEKDTLNLLSANKNYIDNSNTVMNQLYGGLLQVQQGLDRQGSTPDTMGLIQGMQALNQGIQNLDNGIQSPTGLKASLQTYTEGVNNLQQGITSLQSKSTSLRSGADSLANGTQMLNANAPLLMDGIKKLSMGSGDLYDGTNILVRNHPELLRGIQSLRDGSGQISDGASKLAEGSSTLGNGLTQLKDGTQTLTTALQTGATQSNITASNKTTEMFAQPLDVEHHEVSEVQSNGKAMAPYMMSVGLYVACMAFTLMYPLLKNNSKTTSGLCMWLGKASVMYAVSTIMAVLMILALTLINGLSPLQFGKTLLIACLISAAFMSMIVFFNVTCGKIGAFLVLIFMVFQLGGAAGTYPIETSAGFYQAIHPFMPFSYSVDAFRHTLAMGGSIMPDITVFIFMIVVFSLGSIVFYRWKVSISEEQFQQMKIVQFHE